VRPGNFTQARKDGCKSQEAASVRVPLVGHDPAIPPRTAVIPSHELLLAWCVCSLSSGMSPGAIDPDKCLAFPSNEELRASEHGSWNLMTKGGVRSVTDPPDLVADKFFGRRSPMDFSQGPGFSDHLGEGCRGDVSRVEDEAVVGSSDREGHISLQHNDAMVVEIRNLH
jgi:hypothetical protein